MDDAPLHLACENIRNESIIEFVYKEYPDAIEQVDSTGYYPLHRACCSLTPEQSAAVILYLHSQKRRIILQIHNLVHYILPVCRINRNRLFKP